MILEANACETMVLGSDSGEIPNVIRSTGAGVIVPEGDVDALRQAMYEALSDPGEVRRLGLLGASTVRDQYDQEVLVRRFMTVINEACTARQGRA